MDLLWNDPMHDELAQDFTFGFSSRGSTAFGRNPVNEILEDNGLETIIRAHEVRQNGYTMHKWNGPDEPPPVITVFSAPNYAGAYKNQAAVMIYKGGELEPFTFSEKLIPQELFGGENCLTWGFPFIQSCIMSMLKCVVDKTANEEDLEAQMAETISKEMRKEKIKSI